MEYDEILNKLTDERLYAQENFIPIIRSESAKFLYDYVRDNGFCNVLEVGTAIGYSGSLILSAGAEVLETIDINENSLQVARNVFDRLGFGSRVKIYNNDARIVLKEMVASGKKFDMIFLDGAKGQYINYLPDLKKLLYTGGVIFADNVLLQGLVESKDKIPHRKRTMVVNLRRYLQEVSDGCFETELIRLEDGIAISKYKGE